MMWVFFLISLPATLGVVVVTLKYFGGPDVPPYVFITIGYTWFCSISIIVLVPADISTTIGYEDAGYFFVRERLKNNIHVNLVFYLILGSIGLAGLILLIMMQKDWSGGVVGLAMACSNTFGLVTGVFLLGFGLSELPKSIWRNTNWTTRQKLLSHKVAKMAVKLDEAHQELSNVIVVAEATSKQMSRRDPFRPYMNIIDNTINQLFHEDPWFKPQGGRLEESDMNYDTDEKSMAALRRRLRVACEEYYRYKRFAAIKTSRTSKNPRRRFYTCPKQTNKCKFFVWMDLPKIGTTSCESIPLQCSKKQTSSSCSSPCESSVCVNWKSSSFERRNS